jgi:hypothetical protein
MVDLSRKLPDISSFDDIPGDLERYGRCAILRDGEFWFAETLSIHPATTVEGFYWGLSGNTLYISPRGAGVSGCRRRVTASDFSSCSCFVLPRFLK